MVQKSIPTQRFGVTQKTQLKSNDLRFSIDEHSVAPFLLSFSVHDLDVHRDDLGQENQRDGESKLGAAISLDWSYSSFCCQWSARFRIEFHFRFQFRVRKGEVEINQGNELAEGQPGSEKPRLRPPLLRRRPPTTRNKK